MVEGRTLYVYRGHSEGVSSLTWSPDSMYVASGGYDRMVHAWRAKTGETRFLYRGYKDTGSILWYDDMIFCASVSLTGAIQVGDVSKGDALITYYGHNSEIFSVAWSPNGSHVASGDYEGIIHIWEAVSGKKIATYFTAEDQEENPVFGLSWSSDNSSIVSGSVDNIVRVWERKTGQILFAHQGHQDQIWCTVWSPDGKHIASSSADQTIQVWDLNTKTQVCTCRGHHTNIRVVAWSPDGYYLASGDDDGYVKIWNASTGEELYTYDEHLKVNAINRVITTVAWSPDGHLIASGGVDMTVHVWQLF